MGRDQHQMWPPNSDEIQWDPCNQDTLGQSFHVLIIGMSLFQGLCILD